MVHSYSATLSRPASYSNPIEREISWTEPERKNIQPTANNLEQTAKQTVALEVTTARKIEPTRKRSRTSGDANTNKNDGGKRRRSRFSDILLNMVLLHLLIANLIETFGRTPCSTVSDSRNEGGSKAGRVADEGGGTKLATMTLKDRQAVIENILQDSSNEYYSLAKFFASTYEVTENIDRLTSKDYVRLCTMKDEYHKACRDEKSKVKIYKMKAFFSKVLQLEVTGEWDRHKQGGVRGPYVYGIRSGNATRSSSPPN